MSAELGNDTLASESNINPETIRRIIDVAEKSCGYIHSLPEGTDAYVGNMDGIRVLFVSTKADQNDGPFFDRNATVITEDDWESRPSACGGIKKWAIAINQNGGLMINACVYPDTMGGEMAIIPSDVSEDKLNATLGIVLAAAQQLEENPLTKIDKLRWHIRGMLGRPDFSAR